MHRLGNSCLDYILGGVYRCDDGIKLRNRYKTLLYFADFAVVCAF